MSKLKAVIFDMDGLMFDTERQKMGVWEAEGERFSGEPMGRHLPKLLGKNEGQASAYMRREYGEDFPAEEFLAHCNAILYEKKKKEGMPFKPGLKELLAYLKEQGIAMAIASGTGSKILKENLQIAGISDYFTELISGEMVDSAKPDPTIYLLALEKLGIPAGEALVLEDSVDGIHAAFAAGIPAVMVPDLVDWDEAAPPEYTKKLASLCEVLDWLKAREGEDGKEARKELKESGLDG